MIKSLPGKPSKLNLDLIHAVKDLPEGDYVTKAERFSPELKRVCNQLTQKFERLVSCQVQRLSAHTQTQVQAEFRHLITYQLQGQTKWLFPIINQQYVRDYSLFQSLNKRISSGHIEQESLFIAEGEFLWVPYGTSYQVENLDDTPSVLLRFVMEEIQQKDLLNFVGSRMLLLDRPEARYFDEVRPEMFTGLNSKPLEFELQLLDYIQELRLKKYKTSY